MAKVTPDKLVRASRALLALTECEDIDAVLMANWERVREDHQAVSDHPMAAVDEPPSSSYQLVRLAQVFSVIASPGDLDLTPYWSEEYGQWRLKVGDKIEYVVETTVPMRGVNTVIGVHYGTHGVMSYDLRHDETGQVVERWCCFGKDSWRISG